MGFHNNNDLSAIKWQWLLDNKGSWWATYIEGHVASISGIHPFKDGYRALFRGVQTYQRPTRGLNKYHMSSYPFAEHLPKQMEWAQVIAKDSEVPIYITTNSENDSSGKMLKVDRVFNLLQTTGIVDFVAEEDVYYTKQNIWKVSKEIYDRHRS
jgi:hypothetical protein